MSGSIYDLIVIGARCAGSPTAMLLARDRHRVLLVDRDTFPSDKMSTHIVHVAGTAKLAAWGLLDAVAASGCPPIAGAALDFGAFRLAAPWSAEGGIDVTYCPRRTLLDKILLDGAAAAGAEIREGFLVEEILFEADRVVGIRGRDRDGQKVTERARLVIGADGMRSRVADAVSASAYNEKPPLTCVYYAYFDNVPIERLEVYLRPGRVVAGIPTNDGQTVVYVGWPHAEFPSVKSNLEASFFDSIGLAPELAGRVRNGQRASRFMGTADLPNFFRKPYGPGWALVGDAGYHKDPILAHGISDALRDAELLAAAVHAGLSGERPIEAALADYETRRNEAATPLYELNAQLATLGPPPAELVQILMALRGNDHQRQRFIGVLSGVVPPAEFFAPENIGRILQSQ